MTRGCAISTMTPQLRRNRRGPEKTEAGGPGGQSGDQGRLHAQSPRTGGGGSVSTGQAGGAHDTETAPSSGTPCGPPPAPGPGCPFTGGGRASPRPPRDRRAQAPEPRAAPTQPGQDGVQRSLTPHTWLCWTSAPSPRPDGGVSSTAPPRPSPLGTPATSHFTESAGALCGPAPRLPQPSLPSSPQTLGPLTSAPVHPTFLLKATSSH